MFKIEGLFMENVTLELVTKERIENFEHQSLVASLENARAETFKYVNKLLEVEEKWAFINLLLKKLNSCKQKQDLCKTICDGFLRLTNSQVCACCLFNPDNTSVEIQKFAYKNNIIDEKEMANFVEKINNACFIFLQKSTAIQEISQYFRHISGENLIILPIAYEKILSGYLLLKKDKENFYKDNINFINIFPEHIALILENISLYQESEKRNKLKIQFLAGISHEFKTPLNSIIGFTEILKLRNKDEESFKYINNILQSSKHLLTLIQDILDVSRPQYRALELSYTMFNSKNEIIQITQTLEKMIKEKNISLNYTLMDIKISADKKRFKQLIYNLVSNAIKFNKQNGQINIFTYIKDGNFFFEITDTGDGISKRDYKKIFEFFSQVNRSQLKRQLGSGIGLALCKMITDAHGGEIDFKSQLRKGSSFWFSFPLKNNAE